MTGAMTTASVAVVVISLGRKIEGLPRGIVMEEISHNVSANSVLEIVRESGRQVAIIEIILAIIDVDTKGSKK